jgi:hypothetical protein
MNHLSGSYNEGAVKDSCACEVMRTDAEGVVAIRIFVKGTQDVLVSFIRQSNQNAIAPHNDSRVIGESIENCMLANLPVAPGSVVLQLSQGLARDTQRDGVLYLVTPSNGHPVDAQVGVVDYFSGKIEMDSRYLVHSACLRGESSVFQPLDNEEMEVSFGDVFSKIYFSIESSISDVIESFNMQVEDGYATRGLRGLNLMSKRKGKNALVEVRNASSALKDKLGIVDGKVKSQPPRATYIQTTIVKAGSRAMKKVNGRANDQLVVLALCRRGSSLVRVEV